LSPIVGVPTDNTRQFLQTTKIPNFNSMELGIVYFYTATILHWKKLLQDDKFKLIVLNSLAHLVQKNKIKVYSFVIMPNHIHLIFENIAMNGKEMPYVSFMKYTGHQFLQELRANDLSLLESFKVERNSRDYQFWQRSALPIEMFSRAVCEQKLNYIHENPLQSHWALVDDPNDYEFSSCSFYEKEDNRYNWLTHYRDVF
jgi:putative transposase